jgi:hypothetical protein
MPSRSRRTARIMPRTESKPPAARPSPPRRSSSTQWTRRIRPSPAQRRMLRSTTCHTRPRLRTLLDLSTVPDLHPPRTGRRAQSCTAARVISSSLEYRARPLRLVHYSIGRPQVAALRRLSTTGDQLRHTTCLRSHRKGISGPERLVFIYYVASSDLAIAFG